MLTQTVKIINKLGLHARASSKFTQTASAFQSEIWVTRNGKRVNGKSIMGLMMLARHRNHAGNRRRGRSCRHGGADRPD